MDIGAGAGTTLGSSRDNNQVDETVGVGAGVGTALGTTHSINQVGATMGAGAGVCTTLGTNNDINQIGATVGFTLGSNCPEEELDSTMSLMPYLDAISLRSSKRNKPSRKLREQRDPRVKKLFGLLTMFCLFSAKVVAGYNYGSPTSVVGKIVLHVEKVNTNLDGTLNYIYHAALMTQSLDNGTYTYTTML